MPFQFPARSEVWEVALEGGTTQRALVVSANTFNEGPSGTVVVLWITPRRMVYPLDIELTPKESGLGSTIYVQCDEIQTVPRDRLQRHVGTASQAKMREIEDALSDVLDLPEFKRRR